MIGARDPHGFRPLCLGKLNGAYVLASETCALDLIEAQYVRDIEPGEIIFINRNGLRSIKPASKIPSAFCIFEFIYFARPDSYIFGQNVYQIRKRLGQMLAKEFQPQGDLTMPFPDSGNYAALGFAEASGIPFEMGVIRNHYVGRTFIQPSQSMRDFGVRVKLNPVRSVLKGKTGGHYRRFHHPGDNQPDPGPGRPLGRGQGSPYAGQLSSAPVSLFLRD